MNDRASNNHPATDRSSNARTSIYGRSTDRLVSLFVLAHAGVFLGFGLAFIVAPSALAALLGIELRHAGAVADLRAMYGGLSFGTGLLFAAALARPAFTTPALFTIAATSGGLMACRLLTMALHPEPVGAVIHAFTTMEAASLLGALWLLRGAREPARPELTAGERALAS